MPLFEDIKEEIRQGLIPEKFTVADLTHTLDAGQYRINNARYSKNTLRTVPANYCDNPPGYEVLEGHPARVRRVAIGTYQLLDNNISNKPVDSVHNRPL